MYQADMHIHTTVSDGSEPPAAVLQRAKKQGLTHLSFTDHDTVNGAFLYGSLAEGYGIRIVPGVELSAYDYKYDRKVHILGYAYTQSVHIEKLGKETRKKRQENCLKQIEILRKLGFMMEREEIQGMACDCIYKQHILDYLLRTNQSDCLFGRVYREIFKNGGPCDFDITYPEAEAAVEAVKADHGFAVLAHPGQQQNLDLVPALLEAGLDGIEYRHPSNGPEDMQRIQALAGRYQLILTGGSDYHGRYEQTQTRLGAYPAPDKSRIWFGDEG